MTQALWRSRALRLLATVAVASVATLSSGQPALASVFHSARVACGPVVTQPLAEPAWSLDRLRPDLAWSLTKGAGVRVAVIDSGVSADHPSLAGRVLPGADFVDSAAGPGQCDENGHGTLIAGIIAASETVSGGFRFHGVAPEAAIVPVRILRDQRRSFEEDLSDRIAAAVTWAVDVGAADVINLSLTTIPTPSLESAIQHAVDEGVVVVAAAGNEGESDQAGQAIYPAAYDGVIAVAGIGLADEHVSSSSPGAYVDIAAPSVRVAGPSPAGGGFLFSEEGGTSFAAAYVSGVAALVRAYEPELTPEEVAQRIVQTADHPAEYWNPEVGYGVVNPVRAVGALAPDAAEPSPQPGELPALATPPEPNRRVAIAATWIASAGVVVVFVALIGVPIVRRGHRRRWRSGEM